MIVLMRPIARMVQRMPTIHAAPRAMLCLRLLKLGWSLAVINGPHTGHTKITNTTVAPPAKLLISSIERPGRPAR